MNKVFADTSGWANFFVKTEPFHIFAKELMHKWHMENTLIVTTNYVLIELVALFTSPLRVSRNQQIQVIEILKNAPWVEMIHIDSVLDEKAWEFMKKRQDKTWSLVDCSSFVLMEQMAISNAFTSDHHFEQAQFTRLLKN